MEAIAKEEGAFGIADYPESAEDIDRNISDAV